MAFAPALTSEPREGTIAKIVWLCQSESAHAICVTPETLEQMWIGDVEWWERKCAEG
jgi:hypothetical protein